MSGSATKMEIVFKLIDKMSGPVKDITKKFRALNDELKKTSKATREITTNIEALSKAIGKIPKATASVNNFVNSVKRGSSRSKPGQYAIVHMPAGKQQIIMHPSIKPQRGLANIPYTWGYAHPRRSAYHSQLALPGVSNLSKWEGFQGRYEPSYAPSGHGRGGGGRWRGGGGRWEGFDDSPLMLGAGGGGGSKKGRSWLSMLNSFNKTLALMRFGLIGLGIEVAKGIGEAIKSAIIGAGEIVYSFSKMAIEAASVSENFKITLKTLLGSEEAADRMYDKVVKFASVTPYTTEQALDVTQRLVSGGFNECETMTMLKVIGDAGVLSNFDQNLMHRMIINLAQVKARGRLQGTELRELAMAKVPEQYVMEEVEKVYGLQKGGGYALMKQGGLDADTAFYAIVKAVARMSGGKLGGLMEERGKTLGGRWSTLESKPFEMLKDFDKESGYANIKQALENTITVIDKHAPAIKLRLMNILNDISDFLLKDFTGPEAQKNIEKVIASMLGLLERVWLVLRIVIATGQGLFGQLYKSFDIDFSKKIDPQEAEALTQSAYKVGQSMGRITYGAATGTLAPTLMKEAVVSGAGSLWSVGKWSVEKLTGLFGGPSDEQKALQAAQLGAMPYDAAGLNATQASLRRDLGGKVYSPVLNQTINISGSENDPNEFARRVRIETEKALEDFESRSMMMGY